MLKYARRADSPVRWARALLQEIVADWSAPLSWRRQAHLAKKPHANEMVWGQRWIVYRAINNKYF